MDIEEAKKNLKKMMRTFDIQAPNINIRNVETLKKQTIETVLQELEELQQKEKSRIIGNIYEIKIEDLEPVLKPYYISKDKVREKIDNIFTVFYERYECDYQDVQDVISELHKALKERLLEDK